MLADRHRPALEPIWSIDLSCGPQEIARFGGIITGAPVFKPGEGYEFDGVNDYITFPFFVVPSSESGYRLEFTPARAANDTLERLCATDSNKILIAKEATPKLSGFFYGATLQSVTFAPYWVVGEQSVFVYSHLGGAPEMYLNSTSIASAGSTGTFAQEQLLYLGSGAGGSNRFKGLIKRFDIFGHASIQQEVTDDYHNATFHYMNESTFYLPMKSQTRDPSDTYDVTPDVSGNGYLVKLGDGAGTNAPVFENPGFSLPIGKSHFLPVGGESIFAGSEWTIAVAMRSPILPTGSYWTVFDTAAGTRFRFRATGTGTASLTCNVTTVYNINASVWVPFVNQTGVNVFVFASSVGDTDFIVNDNYAVAGDTTSWTPATPAQLVLGSKDTFGSGTLGTWYAAAAWPFKLTPTQVRDLTSRFLQEYH